MTSEFLKPIILMDVRTSKLTVVEFMQKVWDYQNDPAYKDFDIFMDGDLYAVVAVPKRTYLDKRRFGGVIR